MSINEILETNHFVEGQIFSTWQLTKMLDFDQLRNLVRANLDRAPCTFCFGGADLSNNNQVVYYGILLGTNITPCSFELSRETYQFFSALKSALACWPVAIGNTIYLADFLDAGILSVQDKDEWINCLEGLAIRQSDGYHREAFQTTLAVANGTAEHYWIG